MGHPQIATFQPTRAGLKPASCTGFTSAAIWTPACSSAAQALPHMARLFANRGCREAFCISPRSCPVWAHELQKPPNAETDSRPLRKKEALRVSCEKGNVGQQYVVSDMPAT